MGVLAVKKLLKLKKLLVSNANARNATELLRSRVAPATKEGVARDTENVIGRFNTIEKRLDAFDASRRGRTSTDRLSNPGPRLVRPNTSVIGGQGTTRDALGNKATTNTIRGNNPPRKVTGRRNSRRTDPADRLKALDARVRTSNKAVGAQIDREFQDLPPVKAQPRKRN